MKYKIGGILFTKHPLYGIEENTQVVIIERKKPGRKCFVKVQNDDGIITPWTSVIHFREKRR